MGRQFSRQVEGRERIDEGLVATDRPERPHELADATRGGESPGDRRDVDAEGRGVRFEVRRKVSDFARRRLMTDGLREAADGARRQVCLGRTPKIAPARP